jgi:hypothetical protein
MEISKDLTSFFLSPAHKLPWRIKIFDGCMPYPQWPEADVVFVLNPPPLDIPTIAEIWGKQRKLILVSQKVYRQTSNGGKHPLSDFFNLPERSLNHFFSDLMNRNTQVLFMSCAKRRPWYKNWLPQIERDTFPVDGRKYLFYFDEYSTFEGSFEFDDAYRRISLRESTYAQSTNHFLKILQNMPFTEINDRELKRRVICDIFPFFTGRRLSPKVRFEWNGDPAPLRKAIIGRELKNRAAHYALAIACLSEIGAAFTHRGRNDLYWITMGDIVKFHNDELKVGPFTKPQIADLRIKYPFLYLHVFYRVPNQSIIAALDDIRDSLLNTQIIRIAEKLLNQMVTREYDLHYVKRTYEITALSGTLCQLKTFAARFHQNRQMLIEAKTDGQRAIDLARPDDRSRDINYWIHAVLSDWVIFRAHCAQERTNEDEYRKVAGYLKEHLTYEPESYFNLMICFLAAAVELEIHKERRIFNLLQEFQVGPLQLDSMYQSRDHSGRSAAYALGLAAGYLALLYPESGWDILQIAPPLEKSSDFFSGSFDHRKKKNAIILKVVALKHAACRLYYLRCKGDIDRQVHEAQTHLKQLQGLSGHLGEPMRLLEFFRKATQHTHKLSRRDVLDAIFMLPY